MVFAVSGCAKSKAVWYVQKGYERTWNQILRTGKPPVAFRDVQVWDEIGIPPDHGFLITTAPWEKTNKVDVYPNLSYTLEYSGAAVLALDPWMIFRKHINPGLTANRVYPDTGGDGFLLIPGKDTRYTQAWTARLVQKSPGEFPADDAVWQNCENNLFKGSRFPNGANSYNWQDVLFRLMGSERAWVYAPLSAIRDYRNPQKAVLEATAFPEIPGNKQYSLHADKILWALPIGTDREKSKLAPVLKWLKNPATQTVIADALGWIPADPYGTPFDPVSLSSHRNWLTAKYIYVVNY